MTDLKSVGHCGRVGSSPIPGTINNSIEVEEEAWSISIGEKPILYNCAHNYCDR